MSGTAIAAALITRTVLPQPMQPAVDAGIHKVQQPYSIETFGMFRIMLLTGDFTPKVPLNMAMAKHPTTGVGAVADARGEITIYDGKLIVSYGKEGVHTDPAGDFASLLAIGSAVDWQGVTVDRDIEPADIEDYIAVHFPFKDLTQNQECYWPNSSCDTATGS
jgi:hypothetical protein